MTKSIVKKKQIVPLALSKLIRENCCQCGHDFTFVANNIIGTCPQCGSTAMSFSKGNGAQGYLLLTVPEDSLCKW